MDLLGRGVPHQGLQLGQAGATQLLEAGEGVEERGGLDSSHAGDLLEEEEELGLVQPGYAPPPERVVPPRAVDLQENTFKSGRQTLLSPDAQLQRLPTIWERSWAASLWSDTGSRVRPSSNTTNLWRDGKYCSLRRLRSTTTTSWTLLLLACTQRATVSLHAASYR